MKKNLKTIILSLLTGILLLPSVHADLIPPLVKDTLRNWFGGAIPEDYVVRTLLAILLFVIFYWAAGAVFKAGHYDDTKINKFRWMVALLVSIITVLFIPYSLLEVYKSIFALITPILATIGLILLARKVAKHHTPEGHIGAALIYAFVFAILGFVVAMADDFGISKYRITAGWSFLDIIQLLMVLVFIFMAMHIIKLFGRGPRGRIRDMGDNIRRGNEEAERERSEEKKEEKEARKIEHEDKKEEAIERKEIKTDIKIFSNLKKLKRLVEEWAKTIDQKKRPKGDQDKLKEINDELERLRKLEKFSLGLRRINIREAKHLEHLEQQMGNAQIGKDFKPYVGTGGKYRLTQESNLDNLFTKILAYISWQVNVAEPQPVYILNAIDKAMRIEVKKMQLEKENFRGAKQEEESAERIEHSH